MKKIAALMCASFLIQVLVLGQAKKPTELWIGTWKLNVAKSTFVSEAPYQSRIVTFEAAPNGMRFFTETIDAKGRSGTPVDFVATYDGRNVQLKPTDSSTRSIKKLDIHRFDSFTKSGSTVLASSQWVVSADGKTLTQTRKSGNDTDILVFERQQRESS